MECQAWHLPLALVICGAALLAALISWYTEARRHTAQTRHSAMQLGQLIFQHHTRAVDAAPLADETTLQVLISSQPDPPVIAWLNNYQETLRPSVKT